MGGLSKKQKTVQVQRFLKNYLKTILEPKILNEIKDVVNNSDEDFLENDDEEIKKFIMKNNFKKWNK